jgi:ribosome assembly protein YihI (activator of Der GTPase)
LHDDIIEKLYLESNNTNDEMLSNILEGLKNQENFKSLTYKKSKFGDKSIDLIIELMSKPMPSNLDELRIVNC